MKYVDEYRSPDAIERCALAIRRQASRKWRIMEVCGGQTHAIYRFGLDQLLPKNITLLHGPGCPVCITPNDLIDAAMSIGLDFNAIVCTFGDMIRVPGSRGDLMSARARGADIRIVYSPLDAVRVAEKYPERQVVFFAVGFETTAPVNGGAVAVAENAGIENFSILNAMVRIPPAVDTLLANPRCGIDAVLAPGHVCTVTGFEEYESISSRHRTPVVVTGFEPVDLLQGILAAVEMLEAGRIAVVNRYPRAVSREGNSRARELIDTMFTIADRNWRGLGIVPKSGFVLRDRYQRFDALRRFELTAETCTPDGRCIGSQILIGVSEPSGCPEFGRACTPEHPLGPMMVSSEGACSAYFKYRRNNVTR